MTARGGFPEIEPAHEAPPGLGRFVAAEDWAQASDGLRSEDGGPAARSPGPGGRRTLAADDVIDQALVEYAQRYGYTKPAPPR